MTLSKGQNDPISKGQNDPTYILQKIYYKKERKERKDLYDNGT